MHHNPHLSPEAKRIAYAMSLAGIYRVRVTITHR
jgi:hypothetical protein